MQLPGSQSPPAGEYCIYVRKSRKDLELEAGGAGDTLARHRDTLMSLAHRLQINITHIYEEVVSGDTIAERPQMQKLLDAVEMGLWKGVLVMEIPRLARGDTVDQGIVARAFRYSNTLIITPEKTYYPDNEYDEQFMEFGLFFSRLEYKTINRRIQRGRLFSVQEGKWVAHKVPYGWRRVKLPKEKGYTLEPDENTSKILLLMYEWASQPQPMPDGTIQRLKPPSISNKLNALGIPSPSGGKWNANVVRSILRNPANAGWVRWGGRPAKKTVVGGDVHISRPRAAAEDVTLVKGRHHGLVSQEVFDSVCAYIAGPSRPGPKEVETKNPLSGLIVCGECGHAMVRRPYQSGRQETLLCPHKYCHTVSSDLDIVEQEVLAALRSWLRNFELDYNAAREKAHTVADPAASLRPLLSGLEKELDQLTAQEQRAYELVEQGVYTPQVFTQRSKAISGKQASVRQQMETITAQIQELEAMEAAQAKVAPAIRTVLESYPSASSAKEKNDLLRSVLQKVVYTKTTRARYKGGSDMKIILFPKLPF